MSDAHKLSIQTGAVRSLDGQWWTPFRVLSRPGEPPSVDGWDKCGNPFTERDTLAEQLRVAVEGLEAARTLVSHHGWGVSVRKTVEETLARIKAVGEREGGEG